MARIMVTMRSALMQLCPVRRAQPPLLDTMSLEKQRQKKQRAARHLIDPRQSKYIGHWDTLTSVALIFTALVTPFEVSFLEPPTLSSLDALFFINRLIDAVFTCDMVLQ